MSTTNDSSESRIESLQKVIQSLDVQYEDLEQTEQLLRSTLENLEKEKESLENVIKEIEGKSHPKERFPHRKRSREEQAEARLQEALMACSSSDEEAVGNDQSR